MGSGEIVQVTFWRQTGYEVLAEIVIAANVLRIFSWDGLEVICHHRMEYRVPMWIFLEDEIECEYGRFRINRGPAKQEGRLLNEYLIPYLSREDIEEEAENILRLKWPEARLNAGCLNPGYVTRALGLRVVNLPLYKREKTQSILYFCEGDAIIEDTNGRPKTVRISGNTIVINTKHPNCCNEKAAIFHECFHFLEHRLFYKLQRMTVADEKLMPKWIPHEERKHDGHPVEWMEWQARYEAQCLMMPRSLVRPFVDRQLKEMEGLAMHGGEKMDLIGPALAGEFSVWKYCARNRLIQLGYAAARGALNYVNDGYVRPFAFSPGECRKGETFVIGTEDAFKEYINDEAFREQLDSGHYAYVDAHYCLDAPEYVQHTPEGLQMTDWANAHVDQCCLRFVIHYKRDKLSEYKRGKIQRETRIRRRI